jgi:Ankyrin repeats (many copies)
VILQILDVTPEAAMISNGYGFLSLHCACQRVVKMNSKTKERVIMALVEAFPGGLVQEAGVGKRTPLHIVVAAGKVAFHCVTATNHQNPASKSHCDLVLVDYVSLELTKATVGRGGKAAFMRDKKGYLPLHVAVSRHVSPDKLRLLLDANPSALLAKTNDGQTALALLLLLRWVSPRLLQQKGILMLHLLIKVLEEEIQRSARVASLDVAAVLPAHVGSTDMIDVTLKGSGKKQKKYRKSRKTPTSAA